MSPAANGCDTSVTDPVIYCPCNQENTAANADQKETSMMMNENLNAQTEIPENDMEKVAGGIIRHNPPKAKDPAGKDDKNAASSNASKAPKRRKDA